LLLDEDMRNAFAYAQVIDQTPDHQPTPAVQLQPEVLLPEQLESLGRRWMRPEHRLMLALLEDAVHAYQTGCAAYGGERRLSFREAAEWFASEDTAWPFSFVTMCQHLGIEPDYIRAGLRRWRERHTARLPGAVRALPFRIRRVRGSRTRVTSPCPSRALA
jgi:hypothetical protein